MKWMFIGIFFFTVPVFAEPDEACMKECEKSMKKPKRICKKGCKHMLKDAKKAELKRCIRQCGLYDIICAEQCDPDEEEDE